METVSKNLPAAPNRRAVLAFIALADLPVPIEINFHDEKSLFVKVETAAEVAGWAALLGLDSPKVIAGDPDRRDIHSTSALNLNGWYINVTAYTPPGATNGALDDDTRAELNALVQS